MNPTTFDHLARAFSAAGSRRRLLARLTVAPLVGILVARGAEETAAERPHERLARRTQQRNRKQRNTKDKGNNGKGKGKGKVNAGRPLDCPDTTISCRPFAQQICGDVAGIFGPVASCGAGLCCGLCDQAHWDNYCNTNFPNECQGSCIANNEEPLGCNSCGQIL